MRTLGAVLIVRNEKDHIEEVLSSLEGIDEIFIADTGSEDNTVELAQRFTKNIYHYKWDDHFANARNFILSKATTDFCLSIDADEVLEKGGVEKLKALIQDTDKNTFSLNMESQGKTHDLVRLFRNDGSVKWVGRGHEVIVPAEKNPVDVTIHYGHSTAHALDPDRMLRILTKSVEEERTPRDLYYLAREYWYRRDYKKAGELFSEYVSISTWNPEKVDGYLYLARCLFYTNRGDEARDACAKAIQINPNFKEALIFMAEMHYSPWKEKYLQFAELATNEDVLFRRTESTVQSRIPKKLHHIWVGPKEPPLHWMNTWKDQHPDWEYTLWDNEKVFGRTWRNQKHIDFYRERKIWHGVADVVRYEILHEQGGFMPGADSVCENRIDELFENGFEAYAVYENEKVRPGLISPLYASEPNGHFVNLLIEGLTAKEEVGEPWLTTGNKYMQEMVEKHHPAIKILPSYTFNPGHYTGETYQGNGKIYGRQKWGTTLNAYSKEEGV